jgi:hypothetical protein
MRAFSATFQVALIKVIFHQFARTDGPQRNPVYRPGRRMHVLGAKCRQIVRFPQRKTTAGRYTPDARSPHYTEYKKVEELMSGENGAATIPRMLGHVRVPFAPAAELVEMKARHVPTANPAFGPPRSAWYSAAENWSNESIMPRSTGAF